MKFSWRNQNFLDWLQKNVVLNRLKSVIVFNSLFSLISIFSAIPFPWFSKIHLRKVWAYIFQIFFLYLTNATVERFIRIRLWLIQRREIDRLYLQSFTPVVQLGQNHSAPKRPLSVKLFRAKFSQSKVQLLSFLLFGNNFISFYIQNIKIFRFELIKWKSFDVIFGRFGWFYEKLFLGQEHSRKDHLEQNFFRQSFLP